MSLLDIQFDAIPWDRIAQHVQQLKEYIRVAPNPNEHDSLGQTCLTLALALCNDAEGEDLVCELLRRGADPNMPNALTNFLKYLGAAKRTMPLEGLIEAGLRLNDLYTVDPVHLPKGRTGKSTLLDFATDAQEYVSGRKTGLNKLAKKHAVPLDGRRRFLADTVALLEAHGAVHAKPR